MTSKAHSPYQTRRLSMICHRSHTCPCSLQWPECLVVLGLSGCWIPVNYSLRSARNILYRVFPIRVKGGSCLAAANSENSAERIYERMSRNTLRAFTSLAYLQA
jgi:hypothetical protein